MVFSAAVCKKHRFFLFPVCRMVEREAMAVLGFDLGPSASDLVASILNYVGLPLIQVNPSLLWSIQKTRFGGSTNIFPNRLALSQVSLH